MRRLSENGINWFNLHVSLQWKETMPLSCLPRARTHVPNSGDSAHCVLLHLAV